MGAHTKSHHKSVEHRDITFVTFASLLKLDWLYTHPCVAGRFSRKT